MSMWLTISNIYISTESLLVIASFGKRLLVVSSLFYLIANLQIIQFQQVKPKSGGALYLGLLSFVCLIVHIVAAKNLKFQIL